MEHHHTVFGWVCLLQLLVGKYVFIEHCSTNIAQAHSQFTIHMSRPCLACWYLAILMATNKVCQSES